jgi:methylase of polypeptide subunit release factors
MHDPDALLALLNGLEAAGYDFTAPTPATHRRFLKKRSIARPNAIRDVLGWSLPFDTLDPGLEALLDAANVIEPAEGGRRRATLRVSRVHGRLFLHSAFPTDDADSVFLGPDSYRFADFIRQELGEEGGRIVDLGAGAGVGGILAASRTRRPRLTLTDINPRAVAFSRINAQHAGVEAECVEGKGLSAVEGPIDLVLANPPYMADDKGPTYRDGGDGLGSGISIAWAREALGRLSTGGRMLLYTGSAIIEGHDALKAELEALPDAAVRYREIDPDVFGEELEKPPYAAVERIAAVGVVITKL